MVSTAGLTRRLLGLDNPTVADSLTRARFPTLPAAAGGYESYYVKAAHPSEPLAFWIRYTVHKRPGERPKGSLWFTLFDEVALGPEASKTTLPPEKLAATTDDLIRIGESVFREGLLRGAAPSDPLDASWDLRFKSGEVPLHHLPRDWMYTAALPRTKVLSPWPAARFSGRVTAGPRTIEVDEWPGMVGHNWGAQHAERWVWMHGAGFDERPDAWIDMALGRIKLGPVTTPWIANGALSLDGERLRLGGIERTRSTEMAERPEGCEFALTGSGVRVRGSVWAERKDVVGWVYADPDGSEHNTMNCSIATMALTVERSGAAPFTLTGRAGAAYELGMREGNHGIRLQPFSDG